jgi:hypothetical protein
MIYLEEKLKIITTIIIIIILNSACSVYNKKEKTEEEEIVTKKKRFEPNVWKRAEESVKKDGSIIFGGKSKKTSEFAGDSVIWQASLEALEDIPLSQVNYTGGVIISDWYSSANSKESIKISIFIKSSRLETTSIEVKSFKKTCEDNENCKTISLQDTFNNSIKDKILASARTISLEKRKNN